MSNSTLSNKLIYDLILKEYNIKANSIELVKAKATAKDRMVYKIDTISKSYCLKKVYYDEETLLFIYSSIIWLNLHNISCPILIPTTNNGRYFKYNNMLFILTPWIEGIRCNYDILTHLEISLKNLANMHIAGKNFSPIKGSKVLTGSDSSSFSYSKHFGDLKKYIDICSNQKDIFSKKIFDYKDYILNTAYISVLYSKLIDTNALPKNLCHKDYVNKNIIIATIAIDIPIFLFFIRFILSFLAGSLFVMPILSKNHYLYKCKFPFLPDRRFSVLLRVLVPLLSFVPVSVPVVSYFSL